MLTILDLRVFDATCVGSVGSPYSVPSGFALKRGECCGYTFQLYAQDKTWSDGTVIRHRTGYRALVLGLLQ